MTTVATTYQARTMATDLAQQLAGTEHAELAERLEVVVHDLTGKLDTVGFVIAGVGPTLADAVGPLLEHLRPPQPPAVRSEPAA